MATVIKKIRSLLIPTLLGYIGLLIMLSFVIYALVYGNFSNEGPALVAMPWGLVSLVDLYLGLVLFACWAFWREDNKAAAISWSLLILVLGNMITCVYIVKAAYEAEGSINKFWLGKSNADIKHV